MKHMWDEGYYIELGIYVVVVTTIIAIIVAIIRDLI